MPHLKKSSFCSFCSVFPCAEAGQFSKSNMPDHSAMRVIWAAHRRTILLAHAQAGSLSCRTRPGAREHTPAQLPDRTRCSKALVRRELPGCRQAYAHGHAITQCSIMHFKCCLSSARRGFVATGKDQRESSTIGLLLSLSSSG